MKQFWTPLARMLGMVDPLHPNPSPSTRATQSDVPQANPSQWPLLFHALRQEAENTWCAKCLQHAEVNPDQVLSLTAISLQALNPAMEQQLRDWFAETDERHLIQWMVNGPFNTEQIRQQVHFDTLTSLRLLESDNTTKEPVPSPYSQAGALYRQSASALKISVQSHWIPRPQPLEVKPECQPLHLLIQDAMGQRRLRVHHPLIILGSGVIQVGDQPESSDTQTVGDLIWHGEPAKWITVQATHVSAVHVLLRAHSQSFDVQDLDSTNGTFLKNEPLPAGQTLSSVLPMTLSLGGPTSDPADLSAFLKIALDGLPNNQLHHATPLRQAVVKTATQTAQPVLTLVVLEGMTEVHVPVCTFPFVIGRDISADWTVPAEHTMVSRRHLILQMADSLARRVQILDVSRHGLTSSPEGFSAPPTSGTWVENGNTLILGRVHNHTGLSFRLQWA